MTAGDRPYLVSGADDKMAKVWDYQTKACVQTLEGHSHNVSAVCFHPELPVILTGTTSSLHFPNAVLIVAYVLSMVWPQAPCISCMFFMQSCFSSSQVWLHPYHLAQTALTASQPSCTRLRFQVALDFRLHCMAAPLVYLQWVTLHAGQSRLSQIVKVCHAQPAALQKVLGCLKLTA